MLIYSPGMFSHGLCWLHLIHSKKAKVDITFKRYTVYFPCHFFGWQTWIIYIRIFSGLVVTIYLVVVYDAPILEENLLYYRLFQEWPMRTQTQTSIHQLFPPTQFLLSLNSPAKSSMRKGPCLRRGKWHRCKKKRKRCKNCRSIFKNW